MIGIQTASLQDRKMSIVGRYIQSSQMLSER